MSEQKRIWIIKNKSLTLTGSLTEGDVADLGKLPLWVVCGQNDREEAIKEHGYPLFKRILYDYQMKRFAVILTTIIGLVQFANAAEPPRGYRGFVSIKKGFTVHDGGLSPANKLQMSASTTHGFQFNPHLFVGAGFEVPFAEYHSLSLPIYASVRTDWNFNGFTPYAQLNVGGVASNVPAFYFAPSIGYRLAFSRHCALNIGVGFDVRITNEDHYQFVQYPESQWAWDNQGYYDIVGKRNLSSFTVALSLEF